MELEWKKNYALITGASSGIGFCVADQLAGCGYNLILIDKDETKLETVSARLRLKTESVVYIALNLNLVDKITELMLYLKDRHVIIQCLINNAGYQEEIDVLDISINMWRELFKVNLEFAFFLSQEVAKHMIQHRVEGCIINITSIHSQIVRGIAHYSASKAALDMATKELAHRVAEYSIRVNSVAPGAIMTPMLGDISKHSKLAEKAASLIPLGRIGSPKEVAYLIEFLVSDKAKYITGTRIVIDGGLSLVT